MITFIANICIQEGCFHTVVIHDCLNILGINISKCVSLTTDFVMFGKKTSADVQICVIQTHCFVHCLNLAMTFYLKNESWLCSQTSLDRYYFTSSLANWGTALKEIQNVLDKPELAIKELHSLCWLGLKKAIDAVCKCYCCQETLDVCKRQMPQKNLHKYL
ncbi:hypothetical protein CHS0354_036660 [Potamilus streckersoni]|uniref:Uncharacterized protein n=1 Tax=Potamilus streckersoni TaxID=2493646 RepID=A0AAE0TGD6_9BIVA|nr:hypothetical protein CHS0354_036660 [Potamilus streckersoni]